MVKLRVAVLAFLVTFLLLGCGGKAGPAIRRAAPVPPAASRPFSEPSPSLELVSSASVPSLTDDLDVASLSLAIERSLQYYSKFNDTEVYYLGQRRCTIGEMEETLRSFRAIVTAEESDQAKQKKIRETFDFFRSAGDDPEDYLDLTLTIQERRYTALPASIARTFEPARTVKPGNPTFKLVREGSK